MLAATDVWNSVRAPLFTSCAVACQLQHRSSGYCVTVVNVYLPPKGGLISKRKDGKSSLACSLDNQGKEQQAELEVRVELMRLVGLAFRWG